MSEAEDTVAVWDYPFLGELEGWLIELSEEAEEDLVEMGVVEAEGSVVEEILIVEEWANDVAVKGETPLEIRIVFSKGDEEIGSRTANDISNEMMMLVEEGRLDPPQQFLEWFGGISIVSADDSRTTKLIFTEDTAQNQVFNLTDAQVFRFVEGNTFEEMPRIPLEMIREDGEPEPREVTEEDIISEPLEQFETEGGKVELPVGKKDTRTVDPRDPFDFEIVMITDQVESDKLPGRAELDPNDVMPGIGRAVLEERFDTTREDATSLATFPRTGAWLRNYFLFRGASYPMQLHRDFVVYTAYAAEHWGYNIRPGSYDSMRNYIRTLMKITRLEDGPDLIRPLTDEELANSDLEVLPDHPTIEGEKAPEMKNRNYYVMIEGAEQSNVWDDPFGFLHG